MDYPSKQLKPELGAAVRRIMDQGSPNYIAEYYGVFNTAQIAWSL